MQNQIDMRDGHAADRILEAIARDRSEISWRGEEANLGATVCIDAIGFQARDPLDYAVEKPENVISDLARIVAPNGRLAIVGVFLDVDPHAPNEPAKSGAYLIPWGSLFKKGVCVGMGRDHDKRYNDLLRDAIVRGRISQVQSFHTGFRFGTQPTPSRSSMIEATVTSKSCWSRDGG